MGIHYEGSDNDLEKRTRLIFKVWLVLVTSLVALPFLAAMIDFIMGRFSIESLELVHTTTL